MALVIIMCLLLLYYCLSFSLQLPVADPFLEKVNLSDFGK